MTPIIKMLRRNTNYKDDINRQITDAIIDDVTATRNINLRDYEYIKQRIKIFLINLMVDTTH